jgi:hypothetical protein
MEYNDLLIILLLIVLIIVVLFKNDAKQYFMTDSNQQLNNLKQYKNQIENQNQNQNQMKNQMKNQMQINTTDNKYEKPLTCVDGKCSIKQYNKLYNNKVNINDNENDNDNKNDNDNNYNNIDNKIIIKRKDDIKRKLFSDKTKSNVVESIYNNKNKKINNKKVIIDDYSEMDNIKSLNSMDNTLSDIVSIVELDK